MTKEELIKQKEEYEKKYKNSRNVVERAEFSEKVSLLKKQIAKLDEKVLVKDYVPGRDVPSVADKGKKESSRGIITGNELYRINL
jgi:hypothetical protein